MSDIFIYLFIEVYQIRLQTIRKLIYKASTKLSRNAFHPLKRQTVYF